MHSSTSPILDYFSFPSKISLMDKVIMFMQLDSLK
jgi:hypothetical protein